MPILWRYLLKEVFRVLFLCMSAFVSLLLVSRSQDIARFASSGAPFKAVLLFALYQIPTILPLALPISCLIATLLLLQRLSHTHELTALRACGLNTRTVAYPLLLSGVLLSVLNFTVASELSPYCRILTKKLTYEVTAINPLFMLQKGTLVKIKDTFVDMRMLSMGKRAEDVVLVIKNSSDGRLNIVTAKQVSVEGDQLLGENVTLISSVDSKQDGFDHLVIENQTSMSTKASNLSQFIQDTDWYANYDYLPLRMVYAKHLYDKTLPPSPVKKMQHVRAPIEICKRITLGLAAFTFTFIGIAFGMEISRTRKKRGIIWAVALSAFFLICFLTAKAWRYHALAPCLVYLLPHPIIILLSLNAFRRVSKGVE
jgi:lipopolysaccharide export system permease protein